MRPRTGSTAARFVAALAALATVAVGVPWLLLMAARARFGGAAPWHGVPAPSAWEWVRIRQASTDQLTEDTIADLVVRTCLMVAWSAVVVLLVTVAAECVHMLRHGGLAMPEVRGLGLAQSAARLIATGLLVVVPMATPSRALARDLTGPSFGSDPVVVSLQSAPPVPSGDEHDTAVDGRDEPAGPTAGAANGDRYVVQAGDSIYGIAERFAGPDPDGVVAYADRLLELNLGRSMPDGRRFENAALIEIGWTLELPDVVPAAVDPPSDEPGPVHVVERGETLWSIAEDELGEPGRWPEIYEANRGRSFAGGRTLDDPSLILPGWDLDLPDAQPRAAPVLDPTADAAPVQPAPEPASGVTEGETAGPEPDAIVPSVGGLVVDPSEADAEPEVGHRPTNRWTDVRGPDGRPAPSPGRPADRAPGAVSAPLRRDEGTAGRADRADSQLLTLGRAAMLSAGVVTLVAVRRRNRLRRSPPRAVLPAPAPEVTATERTVRSVDGGDRFLRVDLAVRAAAPALVVAGRRVVAVLAGDDGCIELLASGPARLDVPWEPTLDPDRWLLHGSVPVEVIAQPARRVGAPCPTLVQLGRTPDDRDLYVDLEALEAVEVGGPGDQADAVVAALAATLAGSLLAEVTTLVGVGVDDDAFLGHRHHVPARDLSEAFRRAREVIGPAQRRSTFELRARATGGELWEPAVVLVGAAVGTVTPPVELSGLAVVSASPIQGASSRLEPDGDAWVLRPVGIRCVPVGLTAADLAAVAALVGSADAELVEEAPGAEVPGRGRDAPQVDDRIDGAADRIAPIVDLAAGRPVRVAPDDDLTLAPLPEMPSADDLPSAPPAHLPAGDEPSVVPAPPLMVRLLGPVGVDSADGRSARFERSKAAELVAWLATHRDRSTRTAARTAMWELDVRDATFANVVSEARRTLARLVEPPPGEEWIGRTLTEALPLHPLVRTDADLLREALTAARSQLPEQAIATLRPAVGLVVGMPFEGTSYLWPEAEGIASELVLLATSAAVELGGHHLAMGDIDGVFDATGRGLRVLPGHEELVALRMRAHARAGDRAGVRHEWEQYERVITADPWSDGEPATNLLELRRELLAG